MTEADVASVSRLVGYAAGLGFLTILAVLYVGGRLLSSALLASPAPRLIGVLLAITLGLAAILTKPYVSMAYFMLIGPQDFPNRIVGDALSSTRQILVDLCLFSFAFYSGAGLRKLTKSSNPRSSVKSPLSGEPPKLHLLAAEGDLNGVTAEVGNGANVDQQDRRGGTPLMYAARNGHAAVVSFLLRSGADPNYKLSHGETALSIAQKHGHTEVVSLLQRV